MTRPRVELAHTLQAGDLGRRSLEGDDDEDELEDEENHRAAGNAASV